MLTTKELKHGYGEIAMSSDCIDKYKPVGIISWRDIIKTLLKAKK